MEVKGLLQKDDEAVVLSVSPLLEPKLSSFLFLFPIEFFVC